MPCRSDYMEPTKNEIGEKTALEKQLTKVNDNLVHSADVLREFVLKDSGSDHGSDLLRTLLSITDPVEKGKKLVEKIQATYAYKCGGQKSSAIEVFYRAADEYLTASQAALNLVNGIKPAQELLDSINRTQVAHRKEDMKRLVQTFLDRGDFVSVAVVASADPTKPLEPQLGFDPDAF